MPDDAGRSDSADEHHREARALTPVSRLPSDDDGVAQRQQERLLKKLSEIRGSGNADMTKVLELIASELNEVRRQLASSAGEGHGAAGSLTDLLARDPKDYARRVDAAWEHADALRIALVHLGDDAYLGTLLEGEVVRRDNDRPLAWDKYLRGAELDELATKFQQPPVQEHWRRLAVARLTHIFEKRREDGAHRRARETLRSRTLLLVLTLLGSAVVIAGLAIVFSGEVDTWIVVLCAAIGSLGASLSGAFRARESITMAALHDFWAWGLVQLAVGAAAGLVILVVLASGIVRLPGTAGTDTSWAAFATYAFIGGFSEPFLFGFVARVAGTTSETTPQARGG